MGSVSVSARALTLCGLIVLTAPITSIAASGATNRAMVQDAPPELPRILSARVVLGTKLGTAVRVSYCYSSLPSDPSSRPGRLHLTVDNLKDDLPPLNVGWPVTTRCNTVVHPVGGIQQPFVPRYSTESADGTARSRQGLLKLQTLPELARRPELPTTLAARVVGDAEYGRAVRISYCFHSLPTDPSRRPRVLAVTLMNVSDRHEARGYNSLVTKRCDTVRYPLAGIPPPYVLSYVVRSKRGTYSKRGSVKVY